MERDARRIMTQYTEAYQKLYQRTPSSIYKLDENWILVNGARMRLSELEFLTRQLQKEYDAVLKEKRNLVSRLINWLKRDN